MGLDARKPVFGGLQATKAQTSLHMRAVSSATLLFAYLKVYQNLLQAKFHYSGWFLYGLSGNPEDRFSHIAAHI